MEGSDDGGVPSVTAAAGPDDEAECDSKPIKAQVCIGR
jgi:hypothetical protein